MDTIRGSVSIFYSDVGPIYFRLGSGVGPKFPAARFGLAGCRSRLHGRRQALSDGSPICPYNSVRGSWHRSRLECAYDRDIDSNVNSGIFSLG